MTIYDITMTIVAAGGLLTSYLCLFVLIPRERRLWKSLEHSATLMIDKEARLHKTLIDQGVPVGPNWPGTIDAVIRLIDDLAGRIVYLQEQLDTGGQKRDQARSDSSMDARLRVPGQQWPSPER